MIEERISLAEEILGECRNELGDDYPGYKNHVYCVDAALSGLDHGELVTLPSVEDFHLWNEFDTAGQKLFTALGSSRPASRYDSSNNKE
jgi:hypothetical protein